MPRLRASRSLRIVFRDSAVVRIEEQHRGGRLTGILGWPVEESLSPAIHNAAFEALGLDWAYVPLPAPPGKLRRAIRELRATPHFAGANVTMPHKEGVVRLMDEVTEDAARLRAVNTIVVGVGGLAGHNTDAPGFTRFLEEDAGFDPAGRTALILGAGGAARACALSLARGGASSVTVAARDAGRAAAALRTLEGIPVRAVAISWSDAASVSADVVVNATPVTDPRQLPVPEIHSGQLVVDLWYRPMVTPLVAVAREAGAAAFTGLGLLVHQAALSFELWTGQAAPLPAMSAAALAALAVRATEEDGPPHQ